MVIIINVVIYNCNYVRRIYPVPQPITGFVRQVRKIPQFFFFRDLFLPGLTTPVIGLVITTLLTFR
jgi:hypothetical protein